MLARCYLILICVLALALAVSTSSAAAAEQKDTTTDVEVLFPFPEQKPRGGGVASIGEAKMTVDDGKQTGGRPMIVLNGTKAPVQGAWWFPRHLPMTAEQAHVSDPRARLLFHVQTTSPVKADFMVRWRVEGAEGKWTTSGVTEFAPDRLLAIEMPIPELKPDAKITGLVLSFSAPGEYHIRRIAIGKTAE